MNINTRIYYLNAIVTIKKGIINEMLKNDFRNKTNNNDNSNKNKIK
jgi:hypothetical protein